MSCETIVFEITGCAATATSDGPDHSNGFRIRMHEAVRATPEEAPDHAAVGAPLLAGAGRDANYREQGVTLTEEPRPQLERH